MIPSEFAILKLILSGAEIVFAEIVKLPTSIKSKPLNSSVEPPSVMAVLPNVICFEDITLFAETKLVASRPVATNAVM